MFENSWKIEEDEERGNCLISTNGRSVSTHNFGETLKQDFKYKQFTL